MESVRILKESSQKMLEKKISFLAILQVTILLICGSLKLKIFSLRRIE